MGRLIIGFGVGLIFFVVTDMSFLRDYLDYTSLNIDIIVHADE